MCSGNYSYSFLGATITSTIASLLAKISRQQCYEMLKTFLANLSTELDIVKAKMLKPEHQQQFRQLRLDYFDLLNVINAYCEAAIPLVEYSQEKLESSQKRKSDIEMLLSLIDKVNPNEVIQKCDSLGRRLQGFNDEIKLDETYTQKQTENWKKVLLGAQGILGSIALVLFTSWALPVEIAIVVGTVTFSAAAVPSLFQIIAGAASLITNDIKELERELEKTKNHVDELRKRLGDVKMRYDAIEIRLEDSEVKGLSVYYSHTLQSIKELQEVCRNSIRRL